MTKKLTSAIGPASLKSARVTKAAVCMSSGPIWWGERMERSSKRSGWLHTLRSCMSTFMIPSIEPEPSVERVVADAIKSERRRIRR